MPKVTQEIREDVVGVSIHTAARVARVSTDRLRSWERSGLVRAAYRRSVNSKKVARVFDFAQLVEMRVIRELEDRGVSVRQIRRIVDTARSPEFPHPLRQLRWATDGRDGFVQFPDDSWVGGRKPGQLVMAGVLDLEKIRADIRVSLERRRSGAGEVATTKRRRVLGSKEVFDGTRTPITAVQAYLRRGLSEREVLEAFPHLSRTHVRRAREMMGAA